MARFRAWKPAIVIWALWSVASVGASGQEFTTLLSFDGTNGEFPYYSSLIQGADGSLYGTTAGGEAFVGNVFKITMQGEIQQTYTFCPLQQNCLNGEFPLAGVIQGLDGDFYGTTSDGGSNTYYGTIFRGSSAGLITLHSFDSSDGANPWDGLVQGFDGNFYGTTYAGGGGSNCTGGCGTVFKITPAGSLTTLHSFQGWGTDGAYPVARLVQATDGAFYGTTYEGGSSYPCCGTAFRVTPNGAFATIYKFEGNGDEAAYPESALIQASDGNLYGTTQFYGENGAGAIYRVSLAGAYKTVYSFCPKGSIRGCPTGADPIGSLVQASDGNLYGTATSGGNNGEGTIFELTQAGKVLTLYSFCTEPNCADGDNPMAGLVQATNGTFYGTTENGGSEGYGTVFSLSKGIDPFVAFVLSAGRVGQNAEILGQGFTGATSISFNGSPATKFSIRSDTFLTATVPTGATTGYVTVRTPSGTLTSNVPFQVIP